MSKRLVCLGDSFTEGVGDDDDSYPNGVRGWADRTAEQLAIGNLEFQYANLAVRGKLLAQVLSEQLDAGLDMRPDLVTLYAGGNDLMRPKVDIDALINELDKAVGRFVESGAKVVLFTGVDGVEDALFRKMRGRVAIYNEHIRLLSARHNTVLVDMWAMRQLRDRRRWAPDRLHLNAFGHTEIAIALLDALGEPHTLVPAALGVREYVDPRAQRRENLQWAKEYALPWVQRRLRGESSGDTIPAKRPVLAPVVTP
jgi:lysophospholipase L1-like esterase